MKNDLNILLKTNMLKIRLLCIFLPKMTTYRKDLDQTKYMSFLIKDDKILEKYNELGEKLKIVPKEKLIVNQYTMKNIEELK